MAVLLAVFMGLFIGVTASNSTVQAEGFTDDTVDESNEYSKYPSDHYQLDIYIDDDVSFFAFGEKLSNTLYGGLHFFVDGFWGISRTLSNATGYLVQEAYSLDFVSQLSGKIGKNMQTLAGVTSSGFSSEGFYVGFLLLFILILGIYVAYVGGIKREATKAFNAVVSFIIIFLASASFIAYAPTYIGKINDFSSDVSTGALSLGTKFLLSDEESSNSDSVDLIRDALFAVQVKQPWLILQFGDTDVDEDRIKSVLSVDPNETDDDEANIRSEAVQADIEEYDNYNLTPSKLGSRFGLVLLILIVNIAISIFVILLVGLMLFSQVLFIIFATILPFALLFSMLPGYNHLAKKAIEKVFNVILLRVGYTVVVTIAFSISAMLYALASDTPFIFVAFLQIIVYAGIYLKHHEILSVMMLEDAGNQGFAGGMVRGTRRNTRSTVRNAKRIKRTVGKVSGKVAQGVSLVGDKISSFRSQNVKPQDVAGKANMLEKKNLNTKEKPDAKGKQETDNRVTAAGLDKATGDSVNASRNLKRNADERGKMDADGRPVSGNPDKAKDGKLVEKGVPGIHAEGNEHGQKTGAGGYDFEYMDTGNGYLLNGVPQKSASMKRDERGDSHDRPVSSLSSVKPDKEKRDTDSGAGSGKKSNAHTKSAVSTYAPADVDAGDQRRIDGGSGITSGTQSRTDGYDFEYTDVGGGYLLNGVPQTKDQLKEYGVLGKKEAKSKDTKIRKREPRKPRENRRKGRGV